MSVDGNVPKTPASKSDWSVLADTPSESSDESFIFAKRPGSDFIPLNNEKWGLNGAPTRAAPLKNHSESTNQHVTYVV